MKFNEIINASILLIVVVFAVLICIDCSDRPTDTVAPHEFGNYYMLISRSIDLASIDPPDTLFKARQESEWIYIDIKADREYEIIPFTCGEGECEE